MSSRFKLFFFIPAFIAFVLLFLFILLITPALAKTDVLFSAGITDLCGDGRPYPVAIIFIDEKGNLKDAQIIDLGFDGGEISSIKKITDGIYSFFLYPEATRRMIYAKVYVLARTEEGYIKKGFDVKIHPETISILEIDAPNSLKLGKTKSAKISALVDEIKQVEISALYGKVEEIKISEDSIEAVYIPPDEKAPREEIISAVVISKNGVFAGSRTVKLFGPVRIEGTVRKKVRVWATTDVGRTVSRWTDEEGGKFSVVAYVSTRTRKIELRIEDEYGNITSKEAKWKGKWRGREVKRKKRIGGILVHPQMIPADGASWAKVFILPLGEDISPYDIDVEAEEGRVSKSVRGYGNVYVTTYTPYYLKYGERKRVKIKATMGDESVQKEVTLVPYIPPGFISMEAGTGELIADGESKTRLYIEIKDVLGNNVDFDVSITTTRGEFSRPERLGAGMYSITFKAPKGVGDGKVYIRAEIDREKLGIPFTLGKEVKINLKPGPIAKILIDTPKRLLLSDGRTKADISVEVYDKVYNPIARELLKATAQKGRLGEIEELGNGRYRFTYTTPYLKEDDIDVISVTSLRTGLSEDMDIVLFPAYFNLSVGPRLGLMTNFVAEVDIDSPFFGARIYHKLPLLKRSLCAGIDGGFYSASIKGEGEVDVIPAKFISFYRLPLTRDRRHRLDFGLGAGISYAKSMSPTFSLFAGYEMKVWRGAFLTDLEYSYVRRTNGKAVDLGGLGISAGYFLEF